MSITATRRPKWQPPPPSPKILNLPRRTRRKQPRKSARKPPVSGEVRENCRGRLDALFDEERVFSRTLPVVLLGSGDRRERVEERESWRFQAEILRAECNFLRVEREFALNKLERNRVQMERTLRSAVQTLVSGRKKIFEGKNANAVLEEEIGDLEDKLKELQRSSGIKDFKVQHSTNFDKKACLLQRRLEKLGGLADEKCMTEMRVMAEASFSINKNDKIKDENLDSDHKSNNKFADVEVLRRKMEGLSKGMLDRMEKEYGPMLHTTANSPATSSASTSKQIEFPDSSSFSTRQPYQEPTLNDEKKCSGRCKSMVRRIVEQVRAETEQWSQMQEMLGQVREEMEELQASRDFWEDRALDSEFEIHSLRSKVQEWRQNAIAFETKANELQTEISVLKGEVEELRKEKSGEVLRKTKELASLSLGEQIAKEKHILICRLKENHRANERGSKSDMFGDGRRKTQHLVPKGSPFQDIGNSSPKPRQKSKAFPGAF
ncbi:Myosin heavy chain, striated muscle like [Actinidia chinensis var. chinensis]|uniref:Myosin heavy chain, striated muscle like n=1 Tax=Actinidia chinensis var. chinensis TaxID=1590841 RepID=A0A2R6PFL2_ACTCC|nr:Myosin heavy chain, striated muscle like [Actinidia chinensis var. chinensis]